ncbi:MAG: carbohydrate-binding family 9-like protein [Candidatus Eremiobacteraeota bacterium]|nr:carbohydrate-binding family 9-like protein [Candidatus Eremiobacteraeota bacterium]
MEKTQVFKALSCMRVREGGLGSEPARSGLWAGAPPAELSYYDGSTLPAGIETSVRCLWDTEFLYVLFRGMYEELRLAPPGTPRDPATGKTPLLWQLSDVFEVFAGPRARDLRIYREFQASPDGRFIDVALDASGERRIADFSWHSGVQVHSSVHGEESLWESLFIIPWEAFSSSPLKERRWQGNFYRVSGCPENAAYCAWSSVGKIDFHQPGFFGDLLFDGD